MTKKNYRANAYTPLELHRAAIIGEFAAHTADITNVNFEAMTHDEYIDWIVDWKRHYKAISNVISAQKQNIQIGDALPNPDSASRMGFASVLRKFANTLLNAREYGQNVRREVRKKELAPVPF
ncbi:hypothetical protein EVB81_211 [Rhizobium phage RHph_I46]|uniref:Terminase small subunit n=1 Tax=Rhizobium phage RHph_I1_9 TaxID=2509729 RepID=A0A7S5R9L4_9CAUD|nr:hypothetical protein PP936_gp209 [Rhizobium phage RHph_I1_9]QIG69780.1 hypothetical protein EVB81_211 [Rhizobium phage RHph_I46]QIG71061.1 hypothetical protein EVB92_211 [Rhizobium phage RHph_I9]QIG73646.1 hypothetical protein EVC04_209 [Rhizobium phage RHph_I1_9]QIG76400.1 hypothetical protein EVC25_211 [Rhizobium phage RHph_I34]